MMHVLEAHCCSPAMLFIHGRLDAEDKIILMDTDENVLGHLYKLEHIRLHLA
jgi:hypothetical protein